MMKKSQPAANPDAYVQALSGWRQALVMALRAGVKRAHAFTEVIKWGHLVYLSNDAPVLLIRAEDSRVLLGFWRGQRMLKIEPRLKPGGRYEMATLDFREGDRIAPAVVRKLATTAVALNQQEGNPQLQVKARPDRKPKKN